MQLVSIFIPLIIGIKKETQRTPSGEVGTPSGSGLGIGVGVSSNQNASPKKVEILVSLREKLQQKKREKPYQSSAMVGSRISF